jgi:hypothetical protein
MAIQNDRQRPVTAPLGVAAQRRTAGGTLFCSEAARGMPKAGEKSVQPAVAVNGGGHRFAISERTTGSAASTERMLCPTEDRQTRSTSAHMPNAKNEAHASETHDQKRGANETPDPTPAGGRYPKAAQGANRKPERAGAKAAASDCRN